MSATETELEFENTNRWETRQIVTMALLAAIGVLLSFIEIPIMPGVPYLKYDPSAVPAMVSGFSFGPVAGVAVGIVTGLIHGLLTSNFWGTIMVFICTTAFVAPAALVYKRSRTFKSAVVGLVLGAVCMVTFAIVGNLLVTPLYSGISVEAVMGMIVPVLLPFNILKTIVNAVLTLIVYKSVSNLLTPKKKQVRGR